MQLIPLTIEEQVRHKSTHVAIVTYADVLVQTTVNTAQTVTLAILAAKMAAAVEKVVLKTEFANGADSAFNTNALTVGDQGTANSFVTSMELNLNGTTVYLKFGTTTQTVYTAANSVIATIAAMAGKALSALTQGEVWIYLKITDARV